MSRKIWTGVKSGPPVQFALAKNGPALRKVGRVFPGGVACPSMAKSDEDVALEHLDKVLAVAISYGVKVLFSHA